MRVAKAALEVPAPYLAARLSPAARAITGDIMAVDAAFHVSGGV